MKAWLFMLVNAGIQSNEKKFDLFFSLKNDIQKHLVFLGREAFTILLFLL